MNRLLLIFGGLCIVVGGVYFAVRDNSTATVAEKTVSERPTVLVSPVTTSTAVSTKNPTVAVKYATIQDAVNSEKNITCIYAWVSEEGPDHSRSIIYVNGSKIRIVNEVNKSGKITTSEIVYLPGDVNYPNVLKYSLATTSCTQS